jgi:hypothetical protein
MGVRRGAGGSSEIARAALRLRHDLGKYIRLSAPETVERDTQALRDRLESDVLATRSGPAGRHTASAVFDSWMRDYQALFPRGGALAERLAAVARAIGGIRELEGKIASLSRAELLRLDALTREVAEECRLFQIEAGESGRKAP